MTKKLFVLAVLFCAVIGVNAQQLRSMRLVDRDIASLLPLTKHSTPHRNSRIARKRRRHSSPANCASSASPLRNASASFRIRSGPATASWES